MWMPAQTTVPPGATARRATGTSSPAGAKTIAASSASGGPASPSSETSEPPSVSPAQTAPSSSAKRCVSASPRPGEREHAPALVGRHLADDVGRGAEAVEADPLRVAAEPQRPVADQPRAQQRRRLEVGVALGDREAVALVGDRLLRVAAIELIAGEAGPLAEVLAARAAVAALAVGPSQPRDPDPLPGGEALGPLPRPLDGADYLVSDDQGQLRVAQIAVDHVEVGATDAAGAHCDQDLAGPGLRRGELRLAPAARPCCSSTIARTRQSSRAERARCGTCGAARPPVTRPRLRKGSPRTRSKGARHEGLGLGATRSGDGRPFRAPVHRRLRDHPRAARRGRPGDRGPRLLRRRAGRHPGRRWCS